MTEAISYYCRQSDINRHGLAPIIVSISINRERVFIQTPFKTSPDTFKKDMASLRDNTTKSYVASVRTALDKIKMDMLQSGIPVTASALKYYYLQGGTSKVYTVDELMGEYLALTEKRVGAKTNGITNDTYQRYIRAVAAFKKANELEGTEPAASITTKHILQYQADLSQRLDGSTACHYMQVMKSIFKYAFEGGKIRSFPFVGIKFKKQEKEEIKYLTEKELDAVRTKEIRNERLCRIRDLFLFACGSGLAYTDMKKLTPEDFSTNDLGQVYIHKRRQKTGVFYTAVLLDDAVRIAKKYDYKLPVPSNQKLNAYLEEIATICGLDKKLTSHCGRHTYAVYCLNHHVGLDTVGKALGHKEGSKLTRRYAKLLDETVYKDMLDISYKFKVIEKLVEPKRVQIKKGTN